MIKYFLPGLLGLTLSSCGTPSSIQTTRSSADDPITGARMAGYVNQPQKLPATDERVAELTLPDGYKIEKFAEDMGSPRMLAVRDDGTVYVTRREGDVWMLRDEDGDGKSDRRQKIFEMENIHGLALRDDNNLYMIAVNEVMHTRLQAGGKFGVIDTIAKGFPEGGQHNNRTLEFGPNGKLYVSVGSTCNACKETHKENATMVEMNADGSGRRVYAKGLRNTIGFDWHPVTGEFWGLDHGMDWLGDDTQKEELNQLKDGGHYGWPFIYGDGHYAPADEPKEGFAAFEKTVTNPVLTYTAHSAPLDMIFYRGGSMGSDFDGDAIATMRGSWNRSKPSGYKVVRIHFDEQGRPTEITDLVGNFLRNNDRNQIGRVVGLAQMPDGAVLITDDTNGVIYRLSYTGDDAMGK